MISAQMIARALTRIGDDHKRRAADPVLTALVPLG